MHIHHFHIGYRNHRRRNIQQAPAPIFEPPVDSVLDADVDAVDLGACKDFEVAPGVLLHAGGTEQVLTRRTREAA